MNKEQSLAILRGIKKSLMNMTKEEKKQMSKRIDKFCYECDLDVDTYERSKFSLIDLHEITMNTGTYSINSKKYRSSHRYDDNNKLNKNILMVEAA